MKEKKKNLSLGFIAVLALLLLVPAIGFLAVRLEGKKPEIQVDLPAPAVGASQAFSISVADSRSGLRRVQVAVIKEGRAHVLAEETYPSAGFFGGGRVEETQLTVVLEPAALGLDDGDALVRVFAEDRSWRRWWNGNRAVLEKSVQIDTRAPVVEAVTKIHNVTPGGAGLAAYRVDEDCPRHGVRVGDRFFPGHPAPFGQDGLNLAFFALAHDQGGSTPLFLEARDVAGNVGRTGFGHHIRAKRFRSDKIRISERFLQQTLPKFDASVPPAEGETPVERFLRINRDLRKANYQQLTRIAEQTDARLYWQGAFGRLPGSARQAGFADRRQYLYQGKVIDRQVHLGIDLASVEHSPVPAANTGRTTFAGELGIYGRTVLLDHGFGLFSMYAHLSRIDVEPDAVVSKGDIVGLTGTSGLAGGDHLHFSMIVAHTFVDPVEWWDADWIHNNITTKIEALAGE